MTAFPTQEGNSEFRNCGLVVVAAGTGTRFGSFKQLAKVSGCPLLVITLESMAKEQFSDHIVVLPDRFIHDGTWDTLCIDFPLLRHYHTVVGGENRAQSVLAGVQAMNDQCEFAVVHDGARPFPPLDTTGDCCCMLRENEELAAVIVAAPVTDTIKELTDDGTEIAQTVDRKTLARAETPQVARRYMLTEALLNPKIASVATDEAQALEMAGHCTAAIIHTEYNPKITMPYDIVMAEQYLALQKETS